MARKQTPLDIANQTESPDALPSAFTLFKPSYEALLVNIWVFLALLLIPMTLYFVPAFFDGTSKDAPVLITLISVVVSLLTAPALTYTQLKSVKGNEVTLGEALNAGFSKAWRYYGLVILTALMIIGGLVLFIVPGLFMMRRYLLAPYYLFDQDLKVMEAMKRSKEESIRYSSAVWGVIGVSFLIGIIMIIPLFGWLAASVLQVMYICAPALRYFQIRQAMKKHTA